jgi:hypothetical protein
MVNSNPNQINSLLKNANKLGSNINIVKHKMNTIADLIFTLIDEN